MGVRLPVEMDPPRTGGSGLAGQGCASDTWTHQGRKRQKRQEAEIRLLSRVEHKNRIKNSNHQHEHKIFTLSNIILMVLNIQWVNHSFTPYKRETFGKLLCLFEVQLFSTLFQMHRAIGFFSPKYRTTDSRGLRSTGFSGKGFFGLSGNLRAPVEIHCKNAVDKSLMDDKVEPWGKRETVLFNKKNKLHSALMAAVLTGR